MRTTGFILGGIALLAGQAHGGSFYLYSPSAAAEEQVRAKKPEEVAATDVTVARGDTLKRISRRFSGRASYFPQILLFNQIANPDLIHPGQVLRVPVAPAYLAASTPPAVSEPRSASRQPATAPTPPPRVE